MYYVYILEDVEDKMQHYIGFSSDLKKRLEAHNSENNSGYTSGRKWKLIYYEAYSNKRLALKREYSLKNNGRVRQMLYKRILMSE